MLTDTYAEESEVFIREMINLEYLRRDMEQQLKEALAREDRLKEELEYIKGTSAYRHLLDKKVKKCLKNNHMVRQTDLNCSPKVAIR